MKAADSTKYANQDVDVTPRTDQVEEYTFKFLISDTVMEDMPIYQAKALSWIMDRYELAQGAAIFEAIKAATGFTEVKTGESGGLPATDDVLDVLRAMIEEVGTDYSEGSCFQVSRKLYSAIGAAITGSGGTWAFDQAEKVNLFDGYPVIRNDRMDIGTTAGHVSGLFGNLMYGVCLGERTTVQTKLYEQSEPGNLVFFSRGRFKASIADTSSVVVLTTGA